MRLIDADAFKKYLDDCDCCKNCTDGAKRMYICDDCPLPDCCDYRWERIINEQSTIDAVPVIRCKDCKLWMKNPYRESSVFGLCFKHKDIAIASDETDWCSWAERKEE